MLGIVRPRSSPPSFSLEREESLRQSDARVLRSLQRWLKKNWFRIVKSLEIAWKLEEKLISTWDLRELGSECRE